MPAGQNASQGTLTTPMIGGNAINLVNGLPLDSTKSDYLQINNERSVLEGGTAQSNTPHGI